MNQSVKSRETLISLYPSIPFLFFERSNETELSISHGGVLMFKHLGTDSVSLGKL